MNIDLSNHEIDFIIECITMAAKEGFYNIHVSEKKYDLFVIGERLLERFGLDQDDICKLMNGI